MSERPISVLVIDDSAQNRRALTQLLQTAGDIEVVDRASDGEEGLKKAIELKPDVITLDLEMPRLDGFGLLRLLHANAPTPVIVISSYAHKADVFKALELGALDFIAKPRHAGRTELEAMRGELLEKIRAVRTMRPRRGTAPTDSAPLVVAIGASTGGPPAIQSIIESLPAEAKLCLLIAQHMPPRFTEAFAERLDRLGGIRVAEAKDGDTVLAGRAFIAPGGRQLEVVRKGHRLSLKTALPVPLDKHAPSVDRLFQSVARALHDRALGVVLTGMGADGAEGARAIRTAGGEVWAESDETAVIPGMPREAVKTGAVQRVVSLGEIAPALIARSRSRAKG